MNDPHRVIDREAVDVTIRVAVLTALAVLLAFALLLVTRRLSGALQIPLTGPAVLAVGGLLALVASGIRAAWRATGPAAGTRRNTLVRFAPSIALWSAAASVSLPGSSTLGLAGCWLLVLAAELWHWRPWPTIRRRWGPGRAAAAGRGKTPAPLDHVAVQPASLDGCEAKDLHEDADLRANIIQRLTRARDATGCDVLDGRVRAELAADQRSTTVHVAFCPPFARSPHVAVEQTDGPDARIKVAQVLPYGTRLEVRLARLPQQPSTITLDINCRETEPADTVHHE